MFTDANNTSTPTANGQNGLIPAYNVWDFTATYRLNEQFSIKAGVNNLTDERYFTRRAGGYPGPGLLPADGRSFWLSLNVKL
jgi:Fe(3+) dicitrate transport protein